MRNSEQSAVWPLFHRSTDSETVAQLIANLPGIVALEHRSQPTVSALPERHDAAWSDFGLWLERDQLWLCKPNRRGDYSQDRVSLAAEDVQRRVGKPSDLQRACFAGGTGAGVRVLDACSGWGMDGLALAAAGASVHCLDVQAPMVALLRDAVRRVPTEIGQRLSVEHGEASKVIEARSTEHWDVIYLDPMFPARNKGALPGKRLQWLSQLCQSEAGAPEMDVARLLASACRTARRQVVLKRRRKDPVIGVPERQIEGTTVRYDLYR